MRHRGALLSVLLGGALLAPSAWAGTITGTIKYDDKVPNLKPLDMNADPACAAMHDKPVYPDMLALGDGNTMAYVFVQVKNPPAGDHKAPSAAAVIDQHAAAFILQGALDRLARLATSSQNEAEGGP